MSLVEFLDQEYFPGCEWKEKICDLDTIPVDRNMRGKSEFFVWGIYEIMNLPAALSRCPCVTNHETQIVKIMGSVGLSVPSWKVTDGRSNLDTNLF